MAHVEKRGPGRWLAVYKDPTGKRRSRSFGRKLDADRFIAAMTVDVLQRTWIDPDAGRVTVAQYGRQWLDNLDIRPRTRESYEHHLVHIGRLGDIPLGELRPSHLRDWQRKLAADLAPSTLSVTRSVFGAMLRAAVVDRIITASPFVGVPGPSRKSRRRPMIHPLPRGTVLAIRDGMVPRYRAAVMVGAGLGLRRGEIFGLTVDRVRFLQRDVVIDRQLVYGEHGRPEFGPPKTAASERVIPLPRAVADALAAHLAQFPAGTDGHIFTTAHGTAVRRSQLDQMWTDALVRRWAASTGRTLDGRGRVPADVRAAYVDAHKDVTGLPHWHDLRHFYASTLIADGRSVKSVQARLGHENASETLDTYSHLWPDDEDMTRAAIDAMFDRPDDEDGTAGLHARI